MLTEALCLHLFAWQKLEIVNIAPQKLINFVILKAGVNPLKLFCVRLSNSEEREGESERGRGRERKRLKRE